MTGQEWLTLTVTAVPLIGIAGSAVAYVVKIYQDAREKRHQNFFYLMEKIDGEGPLAAKLAAIYSLREFEEHREFIERFCDQVRHKVSGQSADVLIAELNGTLAHMKKCEE